MLTWRITSVRRTPESGTQTTHEFMGDRQTADVDHVAGIHSRLEQFCGSRTTHGWVVAWQREIGSPIISLSWALAATVSKTLRLF